MSDNSTSKRRELSSTDGIELDASESPDEVFELLGSQRRRYVVRCLTEFDGSLSLADLADEVATREHDAVITELSAETVKRIYVSLYHNHVPKLEAAGVVAYDQERDAVALDDGVDELVRYDPSLAGE